MNETDVYRRLAAKVNFPQSRLIRQVFQKLAMPEEGEMMLALPATPREFAKKFRMDEEAAKRKLEEFVTRGLVFRFIKEGHVRYFFARSLGQLGDATHTAVFNHPDWPVREEVLELWEKNAQKTVETFRAQGGWQHHQYRLC